MKHSANSNDCTYFNTQRCAHCSSFIVHIVLHTHNNAFQNHTFMHANNITDAEAPYSQTVKWAGSVHLHSYSLHICLFFSWRCSTRPWRAVKVMLVVQRWKCVKEGRLRGPAGTLQSPHRVPGRGPAPSEQTSVHEQSRAGSKCPLETHCPSTRRFKNHTDTVSLRDMCHHCWVNSLQPSHCPVVTMYLQNVNFSWAKKKQLWGNPFFF